MYTVYAHRNLKNDKYYIGMTSLEPNRRWQNGKGYKSQPKIWADIQNSDWNKDWEHNIIGKFTDKNEALKYEAFLIAMLDSVENGYNISAFDSGKYNRTEEHKKKISESMTGEKNPMFGKHHSEESKKNIRENTPSKLVLQFSKDGKFLAEYPSTMEAERKIGCSHGDICKCCKGKHKSAGGYIWEYKKI